MTLSLHQSVETVHLHGDPSWLKSHKRTFGFGNARQFAAF